MSIEIAKKSAAKAALRFIKDGYVIGLGSGTTIAYFIQMLGEYIKENEIEVSVVPTSYQSFQLALKYGIPITTLDEHPTLDIDIDGADEVDSNLNLIKGMGGALTREKIIAASSRKMIIVADYTKKVARLGEKHPIPIEVLPFAKALVERNLSELGTPKLRLCEKGKVGPVITDNGNIIIDLYLGDNIKDLYEFDMKIKRIPGVIETGLFLDIANLAVIGYESGEIEIIKK